MESSEERRAKDLADRKRFEEINKIPTDPLISQAKPQGKKVDLRSPEERQPGWKESPEDLIAQRRRARREARRESDK